MTAPVPRRPLRVAVLDHTAELGGAELALARLLQALPESLEVRVVLFSRGPLVDRLTRAGHAVDVLPLDPGIVTMSRYAAGRAGALVAGLRALPHIVRLVGHLRAAGIDVIHTTSLKADLVGIPVALLLRRPLVWHLHDRVSPDYLPAGVVLLVRALARIAPRWVIANSEATAATLPGVRRLSVAHPGLDAHQIAARPTDVLNTPPGPPVVGMIGRISPTKGQLQLVRAAAAVHEVRPDVRFRIIGEASFGAEAYAADVRSEVVRLGLADVVVFTGFVHDPARALDELSLCVHGATVPEPFGQVVVEAMARGVPVVATSGGGVDEILSVGPADLPLAWSVPAEDVAALTHAIIEAVNDPEEAHRRAAAAWTAVTEHFTIEQTATVVARVWEHVARR